MAEKEYHLLNAEICLTCRHWDDEKERELQIKAYKVNPLCMDKKHGWPCAAGCNNTIANGIDIYTTGDATTELQFDANFGCNNWECLT